MNELMISAWVWGDCNLPNLDSSRYGILIWEHKRLDCAFKDLSKTMRHTPKESRTLDCV